MNDFWHKYAGITATPEETARANAANAEARDELASTALSGPEVAELLRLPLSTIQRFSLTRLLHSYLIDGLPAFPAWQFKAGGHAVIPSLGEVLHALPEDLHPQSVAGFFLTPQPDLVLDGQSVSAKEWLEAGGSTEVIIQLAEGLTTGC